MIRINLLPRDEKGSRRSPTVFKAADLLLPVAVLVAAVLVILGTAMSQHTRATGLTRSIADVEAQSRSLAPQIARVNRLAEERAQLDLRIGIISRLEKGRTQSVRLMDELARCVPDHLWLTSVGQDAGTHLQLEGVTLSNLVVSDLMSRLERSSMFADVELEVAEHASLAQNDIVKFRVTCSVTPDQPAN